MRPRSTSSDLGQPIHTICSPAPILEWNCPPLHVRPQQSTGTGPLSSTPNTSPVTKHSPQAGTSAVRSSSRTTTPSTIPERTDDRRTLERTGRGCADRQSKTGPGRDLIQRHTHFQRLAADCRRTPAGRSPCSGFDSAMPISVHARSVRATCAPVISRQALEHMNGKLAADPGHHQLSRRAQPSESAASCSASGCRIPTRQSAGEPIVGTTRENRNLARRRGDPSRRSSGIASPPARLRFSPRCRRCITG
jgi:hypothetical protein